MGIHSRSVRGMFIAGILVLLGSLATGTGALAAKRQDPGVYVPELRFVSPGATDIEAVDGGAVLRVPLPAGRARQVLQRALSRLGISTTADPAVPDRLVSGWILWSYDPESQRGSSKRPGFAFSDTLERHRFGFTVEAAETPEQSRIRIIDLGHQKEVDIAPDSEYSWLEWRDFPAQPSAALSFLRRLQGDYESAMSSMLLPAAPAPVTATPAPVRPTEVPAAPAPPVSGAESPPPAAPGVGPVAPPPTAERSPVATPPVAGQLRGGGLLVSAPAASVWRALQNTLQGMQIDVASSDERQRLVRTDWVLAHYDPKNQRLYLQSNESGRWAFDWRGRGRQRHRFQFIVIPVGDGSQAMIYAYHTDFQEKVDRTPDSSQTLLAWEDRKPDPRIAAALLRQLRIVVAR